MPPPRALTCSLSQSHVISLRYNRRIPPQCWYFIAGVTLSALNRPNEIPAVYRVAMDEVGGWKRGQDAKGEGRHQERQRIVDRMREGLVKSAAVVGLPKVQPQLIGSASAIEGRLFNIETVKKNIATLIFWGDCPQK